MRVVFTIFFLLIFCFAKAQFKTGSFSLGLTPDISFDTFEGYYFSGVNMIFGANVFVSNKNEIGLALKSSAIISDISAVQDEKFTYYIYYNHYFPLSKKIGFYNQTELNYFNKSSEKSNNKLNQEELNIKNKMVFYVFLYKGLVLNSKFNLAGYRSYYSFEKDNWREGATNTSSFNFVLSPLYTLDLQVGLTYYFNIIKQ